MIQTPALAEVLHSSTTAREKRASKERHESAGAHRFLKAMRRIGDDDPLTGPQWLIPGIIQERQTAIAAGATGTGKSFVILDWGARIVHGLNFNGKPTLQGGFVYVTGEGQAGTAKRIAAVASAFELTEQHPLIYVRIMPRLIDRRDTDDFIAALKYQIRDWAVPLRLIAFDTLNRALVGGNENDGADIAKLLDSDNRIKETFDCATLYAHHPGKAEGNDSRGHGSLKNDTDVNMVFSGVTGTRTIEVKKQKDDEAGAQFAYALSKVEIGQHTLSGEMVTACVVDWLDGGATISKTGPWPKSLSFLRDIIAATILEQQIDHHPGRDGPLVKAATLERVRELHKERYVYTSDGDGRAEAERKAHKRHLDDALARKLIAAEPAGSRQLVWFIKE
jgi:hypothetical protein